MNVHPGKLAAGTLRAVALAGLVTGCTARPAAPPLQALQSAATGQAVVGIVDCVDAPSWASTGAPRFDTSPAAAGSAAHGALTGAVGGFGDTVSSLNPAGIVLLPVIVPVAALMGAASAAGQSGGADQLSTPAEVAAARTAVNRALASLPATSHLRQRLVERVEAETGRAAVLVAPDGSRPGAAPVDTLLDAAIPRVVLVDLGRGRFALRLVAALELRPEGGGTRPRTVFEAATSVHALADWQRDGASLVRRQLLGALDRVAAEIVHDALLLGNRGGDGDLPAAPQPLAPVQRRSHGEWQTVKVESLTPEFRWQAFLPPAPLAADGATPHYDLLVYGGGAVLRNQPAADGRIYVVAGDEVRSLYGLTHTAATLAEPLTPCAGYRWTVRARYRTAGDRIRASDWSHGGAPQPEPGSWWRGVGFRTPCRAPS